MDWLNSWIYDFYTGTCSNAAQLGDVTAEFSFIIGDHIFFVTLFLIVLIVIGAAVFLARLYRRKKLAQGLRESKGRFRKRDKVLFYGRKMLRKVKLISAGAGKRKKLLSKITRKLLMRKDKTPPQIQVLEPPPAYLQEDESARSDERLPSEVAYMLRSIRIFGVFEKPLFLQLCKNMETLHLSNGQFLFRIGDADDNFYVVQSGRLNVFITEYEGSTIALKTVKAGDSIASLLSFTDVLTGHPQPFKTVSCQAIESSVVLRLPVTAFQEVFEANPETFVRVMQIIMVRLHRVTFTALHQHLGLTSELVSASSSKRRSVMFCSSPAKRSILTTCHLNPDDNPPDLLDPDSTGVPANASNLLRQNSQHLNRNRSTAATATAPIPIIGQGHGQPTRPTQGIAASAGSTTENEEPMDEEFDIELMIDTATEIFRSSLGLGEEIDLTEIIHFREVPPGAYVAKEDSQEECGLVLVLSGQLTMSQRDADRDVFMFNAHAGDFVGAMSVLTGECSVFTIRAKQTTRIAVMHVDDFYNLMSVQPRVVLHVAHIVVKRLSPFVRQIDFAMDWSFLESGRALYKQTDESDCTYIVLSGRLRSVITRPDGKKQLVGEYGRGDLVGVVETLTCSRRSTTVMAVRDAELAKLPEGLLNAIKLKYPIVVTRLINLLGHSIIGSWENYGSSGSVRKSSHVNFSTVAVLGIGDQVPTSTFTYELMHSLSTIGPTLRLTSEYVRDNLGPNILDSPEYRLNSWLAQQEDKHRIVIYQCDASMSTWTLRCIRQADCILIVGMGDGDPNIGDVEKQLENLSVRTQRELVLLHKEGGERPKKTALWLNARTWCSSHHHLQCPKRMFSKRNRNITAEYYTMLLRMEVNIHSDFSRLARWLTGTSVGLVLGGGGARGAAHVGMIKAIQEAGIPIDMVGGVSIGAFMGALWCAERNVTTMTQKAREWSKRMTQWWRQIWDLTYPVTSMFTGAGFNQTIKDIHSDIQIEDLWLPYFTLTTNITTSSVRIHTHGSLWRYIRASMSLSGYMPPLCDPVDGSLLLDGGYVNNLPGPLWRYIRASMTITGIYPPMCDPKDSHLLIDGCYTANCPADVMHSRGARYILAVDVGSQDDTDLTNYGDDLSGWWLLWQKWTSHFRTSAVKVPSLPDIQSRLAYVSCVRQLEEVRNSDYCHYIRPPIDKYKTLQFGSFDEIKEVGYNHGKTYFDGMVKGNAVLPGAKGSSVQPGYLHRTASTRSLNAMDKPLSGAYNFTDLAEMVCKIRRSRPNNSPGSDDEYTDDTDHQEGTENA